MRFLVLSLLGIIFIFSNAFSKDKVKVEDKGSFLHIKAYNYKAPATKSTTSKKRISHYKKKKKEATSPKYYVAKEKGKVFHRPDCRFAKKIRKKVKFKSKKQALSQGLRPCKVCKP